jgi:hypothetical protein
MRTMFPLKWHVCYSPGLRLSPVLIFIRYSEGVMPVTLLNILLKLAGGGVITCHGRHHPDCPGPNAAAMKSMINMGFCLGEFLSRLFPITNSQVHYTMNTFFEEQSLSRNRGQV